MLLTEFDEKKYKRTVYNNGYEDGELAGYSRGKSEGELAGFEKKLRLQVQKKLQMGKTIQQIANELDEDLLVIQKIAEDLV